MRMVLNGEVVDTSPGGGIYSAEETRIGTWKNGKPLYRRVISCTTPDKVNSEEVCNPEDFSYIEELTNLHGGINSVPINAYWGPDSHYIFIRLVNDQFTARTTHYTNQTFNVTIEYTKTTD
ncbi:MAG: hypothetical protein HFG05_03915 [Oscillibacter sp.]|nr:hypothetical protein [Oscillibacter sp.]